MVGGVFEGAMAETGPYELIHTIAATPAEGEWTTVDVSPQGSYAFLRYTGPADGYCNVAEIKVVAKNAEASFTTSVDHAVDFGDAAPGHYASRWTQLELGDIDGDGDLDFVGTTGNGHVDQAKVNEIFLNNGAGAFTRLQSQFSVAYQQSPSFALGDVDGDGDLDIMVAHTYASNELYLWSHCPTSGVHKPGTGNACLACSVNSVRATLTDAHCIECPAHQQRDATGSCAACPPGMQRFEGSALCTKCEQGWHQEVLGTACEPCSPGSFANLEGSVACFGCTLGSYASETGSIACAACAAGSFAAAPGATTCTPCPVGGYCPDAGATSAAVFQQCPAGTFNPSAGANSSAACSAWWVLPIPTTSAVHE